MLSKITQTVICPIVHFPYIATRGGPVTKDSPYTDTSGNLSRSCLFVGSDVCTFWALLGPLLSLLHSSWMMVTTVVVSLDTEVETTSWDNSCLSSRVPGQPCPGILHEREIDFCFVWATMFWLFLLQLPMSYPNSYTSKNKSSWSCCKIETGK